MIDHECTYPEVEIEEADEDNNLKAGMKVLIPCRECGANPLENMELLAMYLKESQKAVLQLEPERLLFHWSPVARRKQINRYGLRPGMRVTTTSYGKKTPYVCFADSPSWAWTLSGGMPWTPSGGWDLWQTYLNLIEEPVVLPAEDRPSGIYEVRTESRVYKSKLWLVGSRTK